MAKQTVAELAIGVLWAIGACAQAVDTLRHSETFYSDMADLAWIQPALILAAIHFRLVKARTKAQTVPLAR